MSERCCTSNDFTHQLNSRDSRMKPHHKCNMNIQTGLNVPTVFFHCYYFIPYCSLVMQWLIIRLQNLNWRLCVITFPFLFKNK